MEVKKNVSLVGSGWARLGRCDRKLSVHYKLTTTTTANARACPQYKMAMQLANEMGSKIYVRSGCVDFPAATICQLTPRFIATTLRYIRQNLKHLHVGQLIFRNGPLAPLGGHSEDRP